jgi:CBS domain-containing protein
MRVGDVMTAPAVTVTPDTPVDEVARVLLRHHRHALPVVDSADKLLGIISETDLIVRNARLHFPVFLTLLENVVPISLDRNLDDELRKVLATTAAEVMTTRVYTASRSDDLGDVVHQMIHRKVHAVPVVSRGKVEGVLYPSDVVRLIARDAGD